MELKQILQLMKSYAEKRGIEHGVTLLFEDDESGSICKCSRDRPVIFWFYSIEELITKLKE